MQTKLHPDVAGTAEGQAADRILRACVHCGFCTATCPTYQVLGDELDSPRGRIYLIKEMLETGEVADGVEQHIDRCLTCRACETACPSGVAYGELVDIGRGFMQDKRKTPPRRRVLSAVLRAIVPDPARFRLMLRLGQLVRPLMPSSIKALVPARETLRRVTPAKSPDKKVLLLEGCVQRSATPNVNRALTNLLATQGVGVETFSQEGCCGALDYHLGEHDAGRDRMRALIDLVEPRLNEFDAVISTASGCGVTVKDYATLLAADDVYREKAGRVASACVDASEYLSSFEFRAKPVRVACHLPCTYQHGQKLGDYPAILGRAGFELVDTAESHLCCGSAGTYSILEPDMSTELGNRKRNNLTIDSPDVIATANVGCQLHLDGFDVPVLHWIELLADHALPRNA